jgi:alcohol dehydrogenase, propanol-preferring
MMAIMRAMVLDAPRTPLVLRERPMPSPGAGEILIAVAACGVCRTDLHVVDGELLQPMLPLVPGHEIVGLVAALGAGVSGFAMGERVGVPWLGATCGVCAYCRSGRENLCDAPVFTGYTRDVVTRATQLPTHGSAFPSARRATMPRSRRGCAPG